MQRTTHGFEDDDGEKEGPLAIEHSESLAVEEEESGLREEVRTAQVAGVSEEQAGKRIAKRTKRSRRVGRELEIWTR